MPSTKFEEITLTTLLCVICQKRECERAQACTPCRTRLPRILADIVDLHAQLPDVLEPAHSGSQRVSGSRVPPVPVTLDVVDLTAAARIGNATPQAREHPEDQVGHIAVASILDAWVRDWRDETAFTQSLPAPTVPELARWLANRADWAADRHPAVDEFAAEMVKLRGLLRAVLGLTEPEAKFCDGVVCKHCDHYALYRESDYVECDECGLLYSDEEYQEWVGLLAGAARRMAA